MGKIPLIHLKIWQIAWPVILSNMTIPLLGMVDIAVIGHGYPSEILSATAIGSMAFDVIFLAFGFLRMSTTGLIAQSPNDITILLRGLLVAVLIATILILSRHGLLNAINFIVPSTPKIQHALLSYFSIRIFAAIPSLMNFVLLGYFFGRQETKTSFVLLFLINISAIILDLILVRINQLGIQGLAIGNIIAQSFGTLVGLLIIKLQHHALKTLTKSLFDLKEVIRLLNINKDIFIRTLCLMVTLSLFTKMGNQLGSLFVAANAILLHFHHFSSYCLDGIAISCEAMVGESFAQNNYQNLIKVIKSCGQFSLIFSCLLSLFFYVFGYQIIDVLCSISKVNQIARENLYWVILMPICANFSFLLDGIFIGATWSKPMRNNMFLSTIFIFLPCVYIFQPYGNNGLWLAFFSFILSRALFLGLSLKRCLQKTKIMWTHP